MELILAKSKPRESNPCVKNSLDLSDFLFQQAGQHLCNQILSQRGTYSRIMLDRYIGFLRVLNEEWLRTSTKTCNILLWAESGQNDKLVAHIVGAWAAA